MSYYSEFYARKKEAGICIWCSNPATHGIFCEECRNKRALEARELYALRSRLGVCCHCGKVDAAPGKKLCPDCLDVQRLLVAERYDPEKEKARLPKRKEVREQKKANGICIWCSKPAVRGVLCYECSIKAARNTAKQLEKKRWERRERGLVRETRAAAGLCIRWRGAERGSEQAVLLKRLRAVPASGAARKQK